MAKNDSSEKPSSTVLWRIENVSYWDSSFSVSEIRSPEFSLFNLKDSENKWKLIIFPENEYEVDRDLSICFWPSDFVQSVSITCEWSLLDSNESPILTRVKQYQTINSDSYHVMPDCPTKEDIFDTRKSTFLPNDTLTVRLRVWNTDADFDQAEHISAVTRFDVKKGSFIWRLERFSTIQLNEKIATMVKVGDVFNLIFSLTGESLSEANVKICVITENACTQSLKLRISLSDKDEKENKSMEWIQEIYSSILEKTWVLPKFVSRREILESRPDGLCCDDLTLLCEMTSIPYYPDQSIEMFYYGPEIYQRYHFQINRSMGEKDTIMGKPNSKIITSSATSQSCKREECAALATLKEDFLSFYHEQILSDFELRSGEVNFPVHKMVLSARSPVFKAMFCGNMEEASSKSTDIPDLDVHTLGRMLNFMYAGTIEEELEWENAGKLYYAADKYQMPSLKQKCFSVLKSNIAVSNVSDILELADRHQDQEMTSCVHDFIEKHYDEVILSDEWIKFLKRSYLAGITMMEVYKRRLDAKPR